MHGGDELSHSRPRDVSAHSFTWTHDAAGGRWTFLRADYRATVSSKHDGSWAAEVTRSGVPVLSDRLRTLHEARAWCETRVQELIGNS